MLQFARPTRIALSRLSLRTYASDLPSLPPPEKWTKEFPTLKKDARFRVLLRNQDTAQFLAKTFLKDHDYDSSPEHGRIIIEAFPGPGALSRALLQHSKSIVRKLILLEDNETYLKYLRVLEHTDSRVVVLPISGYQWSAYSEIEARGLLKDIQSEPWGAVHQNLQFIANLPHSVYGEQLIAQLLRYTSDRSWLYKWGRIKMNFLLGQSLWERISSPSGAPIRCKLGVVAEANTEFSLSVPPKELAPYASHFYPTATNMKRFAQRKIGQPMLAATITPKAQPSILAEHLDKWDFVLRGLFILKSQPLQKVLPSLAPGAENLVTSLKDRNSIRYVDVSKKIKDLTLEDWRKILIVFQEWPFAPDNLYISSEEMRHVDC